MRICWASDQHTPHGTHLVLAHRYCATRLVDHRQELFVIQLDGVRARPQQGARRVRMLHFRCSAGSRAARGRVNVQVYDLVVDPIPVARCAGWPLRLRRLRWHQRLGFKQVDGHIGRVETRVHGLRRRRSVCGAWLLGRESKIKENQWTEWTQSGESRWHCMFRAIERRT